LTGRSDGRGRSKKALQKKPTRGMGGLKALIFSAPEEDRNHINLSILTAALKKTLEIIRNKLPNSNKPAYPIVFASNYPLATHANQPKTRL
jgi:hypothetical protein